MLDLDLYMSLMRVSAVHAAPGGDRIVVSVQRLAADGKRFVSSLWEVAPDGAGEPKQLTRSAPGESHPAFLPDGTMLFTSSRPDPDASPDAEGEAERSRLWALPAGGGEARVVAAPIGGVTDVRTARDAAVVVFAGALLPSAASDQDDAERSKRRKDLGVTAQLFEQYPIRDWDHYLGPRETHLYVGLEAPRDLTPEPGRFMLEEQFDVSSDGATLVATWEREIAGNDVRIDLVAIDIATGERRTIASDDVADYLSPAISPDGRWVACVRQTHGTPAAAMDETLWRIDLASGEGLDLTPGLDRWPMQPTWLPDSSAVVFVADDEGNAAAWRAGADGGPVTRLTRDACHSSLTVAARGNDVYALRSSVASPAEVVRIDPGAADQDPVALPTPGRPLPEALPGRVESIIATADDGTQIQSWLVLPPDASATAPAPLAVFIHGGPLSAWGDWSWRWNPHLLAARGYAVLLPNPALSTGFGQAFVQRGWGRWGAEPYTDILAAVDAVVARPDIDETRTAAMGGSFGGYMANWVAGHTDRFRCIVTHASLWSLDQFHGTTDMGVWWEHEMGDPYTDPTRYRENSPHLHVADIHTPMLVIHGELDHRVPIGEALRLWTDLRRHGVEAKFLYFPDENHWVLKPQNARVWYDTVLAWLDHHLLGKDWVRPEIL